MNALVIFLALIFMGGLAVGAYALFAPKKHPAAVPQAEIPAPAVPPPAQDWTSSATSEFDALGEAARCDFVFAVGALDDERSRAILFHALDDSSDAVALAAAHVLARAGHIEDVRTYVASHTRERSAQLMQLLSVMT